MSVNAPVLIDSWSSFWLGVAAVPAAALAGLVGVVVWVRAAAALNRRGFTADLRLFPKDDSGPHYYTLRRTIWFERTRGPLLFTGHWYRQDPKYGEPEPIFVTRWVGFGRPDGPFLVIFRKRLLGHAPEEPRPAFEPLTPVGGTGQP